MSQFQFILQTSFDAIGVTRTVFLFPLCGVWLLIRPFLAFIGIVQKGVRSSDYVDRPPEVSRKGMRIMFSPSDNNAGSGAFRCMVELASLVRSQHGADPFIVLPNDGDGTQLLIEESLPFVMVKSCGWTIPLGTNMLYWRNAMNMILVMLRNICSVRRMRKLIRYYDVDIVHVNTTWTYVGALAAQAEHVPCVWHLREHLEKGLSRTMWSRSVGNGLMASSAKVIAISKCIAAMYREEVPSSRLVTIYDGVDDGRFRRSGHKIMQQKPYTLVFLGNFNRHKGQIEFSMACAKVFCEGVHDFRVWFIGAGDAEVRHECEEIFARAEMKDRVTYLGFQKNPEDFLEKADVAFTCSQFEGWGRVTAEAMMAGCLAVGADTGATPELISDGITGMLFHYEPGRCDSLATIIKMALANPEQSRYLAEAGRQFAVTKMTSTLNAGEIFFLYKAIISARH